MKNLKFKILLKLAQLRAGARASARFNVRMAKAPEISRPLGWWELKRRERRAPLARGGSGFDSSRSILNSAAASGLLVLTFTFLVMNYAQAGTLKFDGRSANVIVENSPTALQFSGTAPFTIEAWVKTYSLGTYQSIVTKFNGGVAGQYQFGINVNGSVHFHREVAPSFGLNSIGTVAPGIWTHLAVTYAGGTRKFYINGQLDPVVDPEHQKRSHEEVPRAAAGI
jgi:hypothetical protein